VELPELGAIETVAANHHASGPNDAVQFGEEPVLVGRRRQVVEHRQANCSAERPVFERHRSGVAVVHGHVRTLEPLCQGSSQFLVELDRRHARHEWREDVRGQPWAWPDFDQVVAKFDAAQDAGHNMLPDCLSPLLAGTVLKVNLVHGSEVYQRVGPRNAAYV
jgi:hypothetical protein